jgi:tetratricopeptide (TPR) repeat protein
LGYIPLQPRASGNDATLLLKAEQSARRALTLEPGNATANDLLGLALEQRGIISQEAENAFRAAISQDPNLAVPYVHLGRFLHRKALLAETPLAARGLITEEANGLYRKAISLAGQQDADTAILVASELQWEQRWEDSLPLLEYALSKDKDNPSALLLEGNAYNATRRFEEAVKVLDVARKKVPGTFRPHYMIGTSYLRLGRIGEAEDAFNEAARFATQKEKEVLSGNFGYGGLGDAYVGSGRYKDAVRAYERAIICNPENKDLQNKAEDARRKAGK